MKQPKREPLLVDKWLASNDEPMTDRQYVETTRDNVRLAKRFVLDDQATRYCAEIVKEAPRIIADAQDFAIPPFDRTYIEFPFRTWWQVMTGRESDEDGDTRVGYLYVGNTIRVISESPTGVGLFPAQFELWNPFTLSEELELVQRLQTSRLAIDVYFWGESVRGFMPFTEKTNHTFDVGVPSHDGSTLLTTTQAAKLLDDEDARTEAWDKAGLRALRENHRFELAGYHEFKTDDKFAARHWRHMYGGSCGELRNAIALLLFLNRTSKIRVEREVGMSQKFTRKGPMPLLKHRVVTLHVNPKPRLLKLVAGEGIRRRLHDVRGHLCHNEIARTNHHEHDWQEVETTAEMAWFCQCGGKRWWRHEHQRGHRDKGIVTASYAVKE